MTHGWAACSRDLRVKQGNGMTHFVPSSWFMCGLGLSDPIRASKLSLSRLFDLQTTAMVTICTPSQHSIQHGHVHSTANDQCCYIFLTVRRPNGVNRYAIFSISR